MIKTKITDFLDTQNISYRVLPHSEPVFTVETAATQRGVVKEEMVKAILLRDKNRRYVMACTTGDTRLNPKAVREQLSGEWKRLSFASAEEIKTVTGYVQGAVAPLCLPAEIPVIFDEAIASCAKVNISSGDPMAGLELDTQDLVTAARARFGPIAENDSRSAS